MYYALSILTGIIIAVMIVINGNLTALYGLYSATVIIHIIGLLLIIVQLLLKKENPFKKINSGLFIYSGGAIGVATTVFNNLAFGKISVSAILALGLLGQSITSIVIDQYGLLKMPKHPFHIKKLIGIAFISAGIISMILPLTSEAVIPAILSLITGFTIVVSRTINGWLAVKTSVAVSTFFNYLIGLLVSILVMFILGTSEPLFKSFFISPKVFLYLGGVLGLLGIILSNIIVRKISSFYMTLFLFIGQVVAGIILDMILTTNISLQNVIGGILVAVGLTINLYMEQSDKEQKIDS